MNLKEKKGVVFLYTITICDSFLYARCECDFLCQHRACRGDFLCFCAVVERAPPKVRIKNEGRVSRAEMDRAPFQHVAGYAMAERISG